MSFTFGHEHLGIVGTKLFPGWSVYNKRGGGALGFEKVPIAKWPQGVEEVNVKWHSGGQLLLGQKKEQATTN